MAASLKSCLLYTSPFSYKPASRRSSLTKLHRITHYDVVCADRGASGLDINGSRPTSPKAWEVMSTTLQKNKIRFIAPDAVARQQNLIVVDIRPEGEFTKGRIPGALNIQFFKLIDGWDPRRIARRATFAFFGILNGTEYNTDFITQFEEAVPNKNASLMVVCNVGGTLEPTGPSEFGQQTRSLTAAYELVTAGYKNVAVLSGGYYEFQRDEGREIEYDP